MKIHLSPTSRIVELFVNLEGTTCRGKENSVVQLHRGQKVHPQEKEDVCGPDRWIRDSLVGLSPRLHLKKTKEKNAILVTEYGYYVTIVMMQEPWEFP